MELYTYRTKLCFHIIDHPHGIGKEYEPDACIYVI